MLVEFYVASRADQDYVAESLQPQLISQVTSLKADLLRKFKSMFSSPLVFEWKLNVKLNLRRLEMGRKSNSIV